MELPNQLRRLNVDRVLIAKPPFFDAENESKMFDVLRQFIEHKMRRWRFTIKIIEFKCLEIATQNVPRQFRLLYSGKIIEGLLFSLCEVSASTFLFDEQNALPEKINEAVLTAEFFYGLLEACDSTPRNAEHLKEFIVKSVRLSFFVTGILPLVGEVRSPRPNFIPR
jgi:hypothetical protein